MRPTPIARSIFLVVCVQQLATQAILDVPLLGDLSPDASRVADVPAVANPHPDNMCIKGKLVSEMFVLGAKNSGTSSLYLDLKDKYGIWQAPDNGVIKEWFFFARGWKAAKMKDWLQEHRPCPKKRAHMVDFCVMNLFMVPMPSALNHSLKYGYPSRMNDSYLFWNTPFLLRKWYGPKASALKFVVLLREPLSRSQSEYYHTLLLRNCAGCNARGNFADALWFNANLTQAYPPRISDWFWKSMYARHIEAWLSHFAASQFTMIPFRLYVQLNTPAVARHFIDEFQLQGVKPFVTSSRANTHQHPPLLQELPRGHRARRTFYRFFQPENQRLFSLLQRLGRGGGRLLSFGGDLGVLEDVRRWLVAAW